MRADRSFFAAAAGFAALLLSAPAPASTEEVVAFPSAARASSPGPAAKLRGYLVRPAGQGPFPAVVLLHTCLGLPMNRRAIERDLAASGYVALFVDDFSSRGLRQTCSVDFPEGVADAYGALAFLAGESFVDPTRIAVVGYSQGADTALTLSSGRYAAAYAPAPGLAFKAAAAFYPPCANQGGAGMRIPTLILVGGADEVTPAADCEALARGQAGAAALHVFPGAAHGFDNPEFGSGRLVLGMRLAYNRAAAGQARTELERFLKANL
jgi:dienelactone hydrolase